MDLTGKSCPVCSKKFSDENDIVVCPKCGAPYHRDCYSEKGKCIFTNLHKSKKSWKEMKEEEKAAEKEAEKATNPENTGENSSEETVKCLLCGTENPKNSIVCKSCGCFLSRGASGAGDVPENDEAGVGGIPFSVFLDPMGGVPQDEDFDGVTGAELSKYVQVNTSYYLPTFAKIKRLDKGRFNFCAFLFTGAWYLYRKQYVKGTILAFLYVAIEIGMMITSSLFTAPLMNEAAQYFGGTSYISGFDYITWVYNHKSFGDVILTLLPEILLAVMIAVRVICGLRGNRSYYKNAVAKVKKIKKGEGIPSDNISGKEEEEKTENEEIPEAEKLSPGLSQKLKEAGGVNKAVAWMCFACYLILSFAPMFIK